MNNWKEVMSAVGDFLSVTAMAAAILIFYVGCE